MKFDLTCIHTYRHGLPNICEVCLKPIHDFCYLTEDKKQAIHMLCKKQIHYIEFFVSYEENIATVIEDNLPF